MKLQANAQVLLNPDQAKPRALSQIYREAYREACELYIATAYLTEWNSKEKLGNQCKQVTFLIGTDFGLTRKLAMRNVLAWIPKNGSHQVLAVPNLTSGGFHPKIAAWSTKSKKYFLLVGSSNLSHAAFASNVEANALLPISKKQFEEIVQWLEPLISQAIPITEDWIDNHYRESKTKSGPKSSSDRPIQLTLPTGFQCSFAVVARRQKQATFHEIGGKIAIEARRCGAKKIKNAQFWARFWALWANHKSRFQGSGLQYTGKYANWQQACQALVRILDLAPRVSINSLDIAVAREIDALASKKNAARGAWLSEMLCHYFPERYPIRNNPVSKWLKSNRWRGRRGSSQGQRYIELAKQLRHAVNTRPAGARNLAELDGAIWRWVKNKKL